MVTMFFLWNKVGAITQYAQKKNKTGKFWKKSFFFIFCKWALLSHCTNLWFLGHNSRTNDRRELKLGSFERVIGSAEKWVLFKIPESIFLSIFEYICWKTWKFWRFCDNFRTVFTFYNASSMVTMFFLWNKVGAITWYA